ALLIKIVCAYQSPAVVAFQSRIVHYVNELGQHLRMKAGGKRSIGACLGSQPWPRRCYTASQKTAQRIRAGVGTQQNRAMVFLVDQRGLAQLGKRADQFLRMLLENFLSVKILERASGRRIRTVQPHAVCSLRAYT